MKTCNQPPLSVDPAPLQRKSWFVLDSRAMDVSRILASAAIFYFHIGLFGGLPLSPYAESAVEYFVILAGVSYVLFSKAKPSRPAEFADYLEKRFFSLLPVYFAINLGIYLGGFLHSSGLGRPFTLLEFFASTAGISQYIGWRYLTAPMWFVPFIMQAYLLLPLVDWILKRVNAVAVVLVAAVISWLLALGVSVAVHVDQTHLCWICKIWSPLFRLPEVCVGVILGRMMLPGAIHRWMGLAAILLFGFLSWLSELPHQWLVFDIFYLPWSGFATPVVLFGLTFLCLPLFSLMKPWFLRLLGRSTLPFFLLHCAPLLAIEHRFGHRLVVWLGYFLMCWLLAIACTVGVDQATRRFRAIRSRRTEPAAG
jgi:peptidoglycan/LPS O-acetylase OafA/YrhL